MNRFRKLGLIEYNGRIRVHRSLLNVVLHDQFIAQEQESPPASASSTVPSKTTRLGSTDISHNVESG
jgi:hypothetical protein